MDVYSHDQPYSIPNVFPRYAILIPSYTSSLGLFVSAIGAHSTRNPLTAQLIAPKITQSTAEPGPPLVAAETLETCGGAELTVTACAELATTSPIDVGEAREAKFGPVVMRKPWSS